MILYMVPKPAVLIAPEQAKAPLNLGIAYQRVGMLDKAEQQVLVALQLDPCRADERNTLGAIYAQQGEYTLAREEWTASLHSNPAYTPARRNLEILAHMEHKRSERG